MWMYTYVGVGVEIDKWYSSNLEPHLAGHLIYNDNNYDRWCEN